MQNYGLATIFKEIHEVSDENNFLFLALHMKGGSGQKHLFTRDCWLLNGCICKVVENHGL